MFKSNISRGLLIGALAGALIMVAVTAYVSLRKPPPAYSGVPVSVESARTAAAVFAGQPDLELQQMTDTAVGGRPCYEFATKDRTMSFKVDRETGAVRGAFLGGLEKKGAPTDEQGAKGIAVAFGGQKHLTVPDFEPTVTHVGADGSQFEVYLFDWQENRQGVKLPRTLQVGVNARSGEVVSFESSEAGWLPELTARVDRDQAISTARSKIPFSGKKVAAQLEVWPTKGVPTLRWRVSLSGDSPVDGASVSIIRTAEVIVDAKSGEVLETNVR